MSRYVKIALWVFVPSLLVALVNAWAFRAYPDEWGGPNIGGGVVQLLAYLGMAAGVALFVTAVVVGRRNRPGR